MLKDESSAAADTDLCALCIAALAATLDPSTSLAPEAVYLSEYRRALPTGEGSLRAALDEYLRAPALADAPLLALSQQLGLSLLEQLAVTLAAAVEQDAALGRALAYLQTPLGGSRPTLGLLAAVLAELAPVGKGVIQLLLTGPAVKSGLLSLLGDGGPLPERALAVPVPLFLALRGEGGSWPGIDVEVGATVPLPESLHAAAARHAHGLATSGQKVLALRTGSPSEGRAMACAVAAAGSCRAAFITTDKLAGLGPWLLLRRLVPVFCCELGPGERWQVPALPLYDGPVLVLCGPDGSIETPMGAALSFALPVPPRQEREVLWNTALGEAELAAQLAAAHRHGSGRIAHLGRLARHHAVLAGRKSPSREDVVAASWVGEGAGLDALAQPLTDTIPDEALVVSQGVRAELLLLLLRCRARDGLVQGLGQSAVARYHPGVRALFVGPSGTGKTLAAGWLATQLGVPIYRVDLASVTSKYIGETEKNLAQLLARAEQAEVVLLFDEADSLFGKRTDIKDANDRFANAQTNYLLQRIEQFEGITLLTSNSRNRFDTAFARRLEVIIEFPLPGPEERRLLWQSHLGTHHRLQPRHLNQLAATVDLCGGHIRNAVLTAAVLAQAATRPIEFSDLCSGLLCEFRKLGRQLPVELEREGGSST